MQRQNAKTKIDVRSRLTAAAVELAYRQGFRKTTLADVSAEAKIPLGNVYYYFKTKDAIGAAILHHRLSQFHRMRDRLDQIESPKARLLSFVQMTVDNRAVVAKRGCPMGSLCAELLKDGGALAEGSNALFAEPMGWLEAQFRALGKEGKSAALALHLQAALQGVSLLAQSFGDPELVKVESRHLTEWIETL
jgi:TetR/AcrR family transcriptional regulator, transcriptional repressor for nem operon